jgi:uncharacterized protein (DUF1330 family)
MEKTIRGLPVEIYRMKASDVAFVFVSGEYAGSADRDPMFGTWGAYTLYRTGEVKHSEGMWDAIDRVISDHVESAVKAVLAR